MKIKINIYSITLSVILLVIVICTLTNCGGTIGRKTDKEITGSDTRQKSAYDPLGLPADRELIPQKYPVMAYNSPDSTLLSDSIKILPQHYDDIDSSSNQYARYRIQLFSSNTYGQALREYRIAQEVFDQEAYLSFEVPYHKVRIGDFHSRVAAEDYLPAAMQAGYTTAWVVRVTLNMKSLEDIYDDEDSPMMNIQDRPEDSSYTEPVPSDEFNSN